ncbi:hypothetical protein P4S55_24050 [Shewanella sp. PP-Sp27a-2]|nr:hypothetical protein [Shewanella baltica]
MGSEPNFSLALMMLLVASGGSSPWRRETPVRAYHRLAESSGYASNQCLEPTKQLALQGNGGFEAMPCQFVAQPQPPNPWEHVWRIHQYPAIGKIQQ